jgi:hypothetical protein
MIGSLHLLVAILDRQTKGGTMRLVVIESPYAGAHAGDQTNVERNLRYLRACMADCFARDEAPFASHGLYTQPGVLDDNDVAERERGIQAGFAWREMAEATVVYQDLGISRGMGYGIRSAIELAHELRALIGERAHVIEYRTLGPQWESQTGPCGELLAAFATSRWGAAR